MERVQLGMDCCAGLSARHPERPRAFQPDSQVIWDRVIRSPGGILAWWRDNRRNTPLEARTMKELIKGRDETPIAQHETTSTALVPRFSSPPPQMSLPGLPPAAWYIPEFVTTAEEAYLVRKVRPRCPRRVSSRRSVALTCPSAQIAESPLPRWKPTPTGRRLQYLGGTLTKNNLLIPEALPDYCTQLYVPPPPHPP